MKKGFTRKNFSKKNLGGFTLIELLIVIAIIGILASVVTSSLNSARDKGADAAIKANLNSIRSQANIWYDDNGQVYGTAMFPPIFTCEQYAAISDGIFTDSKIFEAISAAYAFSGVAANSRCFAYEDTWFAAVQLKTSDGYEGPLPDAWCVDSLGNARSSMYQAPVAPFFGDINDAINFESNSCM